MFSTDKDKVLKKDSELDVLDIEEEEETVEDSVENTSDKKRKVSVSLILMIAGALLIVGALVKLAMVYIDYSESNQLYSGLEEEYTKTSNPGKEPIKSSENHTQNSSEAKEVPWYEMLTVDMDGLKAVNKDVIGWIYFENESISYPVLFSGDNDYYLRRSIDKKSATAGSIFMECLNTPDFTDSHTILYGHNMRNLSMFGKLKYYKEEDDYYENHQYFQIITKEMVYRYRIFGYETVDADDETIYTVPYGPTEEFTKFITKLRKKSERQTDVEVVNTDRILTLSTCTKTVGDDDKRFVVHAVLVDQHELGK